MMLSGTPSRRAALLHGSGYAGGDLIRLLLRHPEVSIEAVTSRAFAGQPVWKAHPDLRGQTDLVFSADDVQAVEGCDVVFIAAEHGKGVEAVRALFDAGYSGAIIDLSADFRFKKAALYDEWFGFTHPSPELLDQFQYGLPELFAPYPPGTRLIANPGCFATGVTLALWPLAKNLSKLDAAVTALTGASGSGARPKEGTHFPTRDGNVRAYKVLNHQHLPEVLQSLGDHCQVQFVPVSGPWTRGIWGTAIVNLDDSTTEQDVAAWFNDAYESSPFVRLWPGVLPEMRFSVNTPFCDIGWIVKDSRLVVGFGLDNLLKGAASQAVHNMNLLLGLPETAGLIPASTATIS